MGLRRAAPLPPPAPSSPCARAPRRRRRRCLPRFSLARRPRRQRPHRFPPHQSQSPQRPLWQRHPPRLRRCRRHAPRLRPRRDPARPPRQTALPRPQPRRHPAPRASPGPGSPLRNRGRPTATPQRPRLQGVPPRRVRQCRSRLRAVSRQRPLPRQRRRAGRSSSPRMPALRPGRQPLSRRRRQVLVPLAPAAGRPHHGPRPAPRSPAPQHGPGPMPRLQRHGPRPQRHGPLPKLPARRSGQPQAPLRHRNGQRRPLGPLAPATPLGPSPAAPVRPRLQRPGRRNHHKLRLGLVRLRRCGNPRPPERRCPAAPLCLERLKAEAPRGARALAVPGPMRRPPAGLGNPAVPVAVVPNLSAGPNRVRPGNRDQPPLPGKPAGIRRAPAPLGPSVPPLRCPCARGRPPVDPPCRSGLAPPPTAQEPGRAVPPPRRWSWSASRSAATAPGLARSALAGLRPPAVRACRPACASRWRRAS
jgi:hypothetical protein